MHNTGLHSPRIHVQTNTCKFSSAMLLTENLFNEKLSLMNYLEKKNTRQERAFVFLFGDHYGITKCVATWQCVSIATSETKIYATVRNQYSLNTSLICPIHKETHTKLSKCLWKTLSSPHFSANDRFSVKLTTATHVRACSRRRNT